MENSIKKKSGLDINGLSHSRHIIFSTKKELLEIFGKPNVKIDNDYIQNTWSFEVTENDEVWTATLYDYNQGDFKDDDLIQFNIGTKTPVQGWLTKEILLDKLFSTNNTF